MNYDNVDKDRIIRDNILQTKTGIYKICPEPCFINFTYVKNSNIDPINAICKVSVQNQHTIDVANIFSNHGIENIKNIPPVMMYPMGADFNGTNYESHEGIFDDQIILKTNYSSIVRKQYNYFNTKEQKNVIYTSPITIIRDSSHNLLPIENIFTVGVITVCYQNKNKLLNNELFSADLLLFQIYMETVFQAAICKYHEILLLPLFGPEHNIPVCDQIKIYNICIMKFSHYFKVIVICVSSPDLFNLVDDEIIKPHDLTKCVDMEYMANDMASRIMKN